MLKQRRNGDPVNGICAPLHQPRFAPVPCSDSVCYSTTILLPSHDACTALAATDRAKQTMV